MEQFVNGNRSFFRGRGENQFYMCNDKLTLNSIFILRKASMEKVDMKPLVRSLVIVVDLQHDLLSPVWADVEITFSN
jgi:hypothetical protein